jgi:geranylgeranyl diphosphate synthase type II
MIDFEQRFNDYRAYINEKLAAYVATDGSKICDSMNYSVMAGGKRIRPVLALECCRLCCGDYKKATAFACALEIIHSYSLIYDDLPCMDNDTMRRGKPTNHVVFGEDIALMAGMGLYCRAFEIVTDTYKEFGLTETQLIDGIKALLKASGMNGIVLGQVLDIDNVAGKHTDLDYIQRVHDYKTSAMLEASSEVGAICGGATEKQRAALLEYSKNIGLAFQIRDDILDVTGTDGNMGKTLGKDRESGKTTFVDIFGVGGAQRKVVELTERAKSAISCFYDGGFLISFADYLCGRDN